MLNARLSLLNKVLARPEISLEKISTSEMSFLDKALKNNPKITNKKLLESLLKKRLDLKQIDVMPNIAFMGVNLMEQVNTWLTVNLELEELDYDEAFYFEGKPSDIDDDLNKGLLFAHNILVEVLNGRLTHGEIPTMPDLSFTGVVGATHAPSATILPIIGFGDSFHV